MARFLMLDRMEINGFKSFYGRTRFEFPPGITAVVGPNGCGKSNIGDAISWVLGEQKASSLRSERMEDVIFNGSEGRRPLGMAEVSLHFRNVGGAGGNGNGGGNGHTGAAAGEEGPSLAPAALETDTALPIPGVLEAPAPEGSEGERDETAAGEAREPVEAPPAAGRFTIEEIPDEVIVTRRLYRSGESEYALNGRRCRLRDIQDLLARTQVGTRLYSTIEQGKIDQILASKPRDRRAMFEEAAGILGYKTRRRQSEIKLEAAQANLLRISDITSEVEKQINSLKRQAAKARRYRRLLEGLRERRAAIARQRLQTYDDDHRVTLEALENLKAREAGAAAALARDEAGLEELRLRLEEGEEGARRRREEIHALDMQIDRLQGLLRAGEEQARERRERLAALAEESERLAGREQELMARARVLAAGAETEAARVEEAAGALDRVEAEHQERARTLAGRESLLEQARAALLGHLDLLGDLGPRRAALEEQLRAARADLARVSGELEGAEAGRAALAAALGDLEEREGSDRARLDDRVLRRDGLQAEERAAAAGLATLEKRAEELKGRSAALAERLAALEDMERQHAGFAEGVATILKGAAGFTPQGVVGERLSVPRELTRAVEAALGDLLEGVLVGGPDDALLGIAHLRRHALGRASFVGGRHGAADPEAEGRAAPVLPAGLAGHPGVLGLLGERVSGAVRGGPVDLSLGRTVLVDDLRRALDLQAAHPGWAFVTPQGDIVRPDGALTGGDGPAAQHGVLARRAEREEIARQLAEAASERDAAEAVLLAQRAGLASIQERLLDAEAARQEEERSTLESALTLERKRVDLKMLAATVPLLAGETDRLGREIGRRQSEAAGLAEEAAAAESRRRAMEDGIRSEGEAIAALRAALEGIRQEAADAKALVAAGRQRLQALAREREAVEESVREATSTVARRAAEREEGEARIAAIAEQGGALQEELEGALAARAGAASRDEAAHAGLAYDRSLLHARDQAVKEGRAAHAVLREELQGRELHRARLESDLDHLGRLCRDDLGIGLEELRARPPDAPEDGAARSLEDLEREVEGMKADLESIGPVNLMAIEQHGELEERYTFLLAQKKDLEDAIASLRETIRKINRQSRERFLSAFEAIQANFARSFTILFGGGKAELRLEEREEDVLEAGIEIAAQPPGKRLQSITLLSGGEKALTAVALLFALFRYRPSPFCVLDEVDAPLDEANVERFTRLLQQLRDETQFILITHNRKSMEAADLLYGVTMEEPGVSKVLPLRFE